MDEREPKMLRAFTSLQVNSAGSLEPKTIKGMSPKATCIQYSVKETGSWNQPGWCLEESAFSSHLDKKQHERGDAAFEDKASAFDADMQHTECACVRPGTLAKVGVAGTDKHVDAMIRSVHPWTLKLFSASCDPERLKMQTPPTLFLPPVLLPPPLGSAWSNV